MRNILISQILYFSLIWAQNPDQHYVLYTHDIYDNIEFNYNNNIVISSDGLYLQLAEGTTQGYIELKTQIAQFPFNRGLPSWNGLVTDDNSGFHVQMRFPYNGVWPNNWYTIGYWEEYIWNSYGLTNFTGGYVDIDYVKLNTYQSEWQFRINIKRQSADEPSPKLNKLSFFISDSKTENNIDYNTIVNDNPGFVYHDTEHIYQYSVDPNIGGDICSPTSTTMALMSFLDDMKQPKLDVEVLTFAQDNYDTYHGLFGVWPNAVQNASEYRSIDGQYRIDGAVTRYRTWSDAYDVLNKDGRIVMSVGQPLYSGHLMMLAGFMPDGRVIVHDPAKQSGYQKIYDKAALSESWFKKGGISYTFYLIEDSDKDAIPNRFDNCPNNFNPQQEDDNGNGIGNVCDPIFLNVKEYNELNEKYILNQNYPNPFNSETTISFYLSKDSDVIISIYDITGRIIETLYNQYTGIGTKTIKWNAENLPAGTYYIQLTTDNYQKVIKTVHLK